MKIMLIGIAICWVIALILPQILKIVRNQKGDSSEKK